MGTRIVGSSGYHANVTKDGRLETATYTQYEISRESDKGHAFELSLPKLTFSAGSENVILYLKNTSSMNFRIHDIRFCWNGGSTNYNRSYWARIYKGMAEPTANAVTGTYGAGSGPHTLNLSSTVSPNIDLQYWDGVGTGMTVSDNGEILSTGCIGPGGKLLNYHGSLILSPSTVIGITVEPDETGDGTINILGYNE